MKKRFVLILSICLIAATVFASEKSPAENSPQEIDPGALSVASVFEKIGDIKNKEIFLSATVIGACGGGCKMWVADEGYEKGDSFILVRAKDDAFKFDTDLAGKSVTLKGYAVGSYLDFCPEDKTDDSTRKKKKSAVETVKEEKDCKPRILSGSIGAITFFALSVEGKK